MSDHKKTVNHKFKIKCNRWLLSALLAFGGLYPKTTTGAATLNTIGPGPGATVVVTSRFDVGTGLTGLTYNNGSDAGFGPSLIYSVRQDALGNSTFTTI